MNIARILTSQRYGFRYAQVSGYGDCDHASAWTFDDEQIVRDRHWHIRPGDVVFDIGAAFGSYALPALAMGGRVIAFSPCDFDTDLLRVNLELNPELAKRCLVVRDGIHERDGWFDSDKSVFSNTPREGKQWLKCRTLDSFLAERPGIDRIDWIKMDIEGAEVGALKGAEQCLRRFKPRLLIECHQFHNGNSEREVTAFLSGLGYAGVSHPHCAVSHAYFEAR